MSDTANNPPQPTASQRPKRTWRRRLLRLGVIMLVVLVLVRVLFGVLLPVAINRAAGLYGLSVGYERAEMNLLSGDVGLWHLTVTPKSAAGGATPEPIARVGYVRGNISTLSLLKLRLDVWRAEADGAELTVERLPDGRIPVLERVLAALPPKDPSAPPPARPSSKPPEPLVLASPIKIDALRLSHAIVKFRDRAVQPEFATELGVDFRLSDVGSSVRPVTMEAAVWSDPGLDLFRLQGVGKSQPDKLEADFRVLMRGLTLEDLATYLRPFGIRPTGRTIAGWGNMRVQVARGAAPNVHTATAQLTITDAALSAAGATFASLKSLTVDVQSVGADAARVGQIAADGANISLRRNDKGLFSIAGVEFVAAEPSPPTTRPSGQPAVAKTSPAAAQPPGGRPYIWSIGEVKVTNAVAHFEDVAISPEVQIDARLDELSVRNVTFDPSSRDAPAEISAKAAIPGVIGEASASGTVAPFAPNLPVRLTLRAGEIRPDRLKPYLDMLAIESQLVGAELTAELTAGVRRAADGGPPLFDAALTEVKYRDQETHLLSFPRMAVAGFRMLPVRSPGAPPPISVETIELVGPDLPVRRDPGGLLVFAGSRRTPGTFVRRVETALETAVEAATQPATNAAAGIVLQIPPLKIDRFDWSGIRIAWSDGSTQPPTQLGIADAGLQIEHLDIDLTPGNDGAPPTTQPARNGKIRGFLAAPGVVERLTLDGTIASGQGSVTLGVHIAGNGITGKAVAPYLTPSGITPVLEDGSVKASAEIRLSQVSSDVLRGSFAAGEIAWKDGERELAAVDSATVDDIEFGAKELRIGEVSIVRPRATLARDAAGALVGGGVRVELPAGSPPDSPPATTAPATRAVIVPLKYAINLKSLSVTEAALHWTDACVAPDKPLDLELNADAKLAGFLFAEAPGEAPPATFEVKLRIPTFVDALVAEGSIDASPRSAAVSVKARGSGIRAESIAPYFPDGIEPTLAAGRFSVNLEAAVAAAPEGGYAARAAVRDLEYADGERQLATVKSARFAATRIDLPGGVIALDEIASSGVQTQVDLQEDYLPAMLGIALRPSKRPPATQPAEVVALGAESTGTAAPDAAAIAAGARKPLPLLTLEKLDLRLDRLTINNRATPAAAPATLADVTLQNLNRLEWGGKAAQDQPATQFRFSGRVDPLVQAIRAEAAVAPFVDQPSVKLQVHADGVRGQGLTELLPQLADLIDGQRLTDGRFALNADLQLQPDRRGGVADYTRGFGAELTVRDTTFRNGADGPVLAGVEQVHATGMRVEPAGGNVIIKSVEITKPSAYVLRDSQGIEAMGILVKVLPTEPATQPAEPAPAAEPKVVATEAAPPATQPAAQQASAEFRIDRLNWSGLDLRIEDRTVEPPLLLPINGFELEATGLGTRVLSEPRPIRFGMLVTAGKVSLPKRTGGRGIAGALGDLGALMGGKKDEQSTAPVFEDREMFSQVAATGRVVLYPQPAGWVKTGVSGLELASLRGFAQSFGVTLDGGVFDSSSDLRMKSAGDINLRTRLVFTDLQLSEPANGPIVRHLKLPAPLDAVIAAVQDADGSITLPLEVPIQQGELKMGAIIGSAVGALGQVLATAVASTPVKAVTGVGALIGIGDNDKKPAEPRVITIDFAPGDASISAAEMGKIRPLLDQLRQDKNVDVTLRHELSPADVALAAERANPPRSDAAAIAEQLRQRRTALLSDRAEIAARAQSQLAVLDPRKPAPAVEELRQIDRQISQTDSAMEAMFEQLRPGADRQAPRRTRTAAIDLGRQRLDVVINLLVPTEAPHDLADRVRAPAAGFTVDESASADAGGRVIVTVIQRKK